MSAPTFVNIGITSILSPDPETSLRRNFSADMSSRKWMAMALHGLPDKHCLVEEEKGEVNAQKATKPEEPRDTSIWSSIISEKTEQSPAPLAAPYVPPPVKRSPSTLSEKSLQVCTESLGSETGSDGFSSYPSSDNEEKQAEEMKGTTLSSSALIDNKKRQVQQVARATRSFPPPLPSLSHQNGASIHVRSHRNNGHLVLEAISVIEHKNFRAQRQEGRLVLAFINEDTFDDHRCNDELLNMDEEDIEQTSNDTTVPDREVYHQEDVDTEETGHEAELEMQALPMLPHRELSVGKFAILVNKPVVLANMNTNPVLPDKFVGEVVFETIKLRQSLSQQLTRVARKIIEATATIYGNTIYDYLLTSLKSAALEVDEHPIISYLVSANERRDMLLLRGYGADYLVPLIHKCKDTRRSLIFLGPPRCIATW